jgi:hypothetical protein
MRPESEQAAAIVRGRTAGAPVDVALVVDPSVAAIAEHIDTAVPVPLEDLPGFPRPASGPHKAQLVAGILGTARIAVLEGRFPYYETGDIGSMRVPLETLACSARRPLSSPRRPYRSSPRSAPAPSSPFAIIST